MPLKRHPALQDLSRDHHLFLLEVRNVQWMLDGDERATSLNETIERLLEFWKTDGEPHLREEEDVLLPFLQEVAPETCENIELERHVNVEHGWLRSKLEELADLPRFENTTPLLKNISNFIEKHIRHEEREIFQQIQDALSDEQLNDLHQRSIAFRKAHRGEDKIGPAQANSTDE